MFDAREGHDKSIKSKSISNTEIAVGDVVLVEAFLSRSPAPVDKSLPGTTEKFEVSFKLEDIILFAKHQKGVRSRMLQAFERSSWCCSDSYLT